MKTEMTKRESFLAGIAVGAVIMFVLDPDRGRRRRALIRDQAVHGVHEVGSVSSGILSRGRHLRNRTRGAWIDMRTRRRADEIADHIVEARVRSELGRLTSSPSTVRVRAEHGRVTLLGRAAVAEMQRLVDGVENVPGVKDVINRLASMDHLA